MTKSIGTVLCLILLLGKILPAAAQMTSAGVQTCNDSNATLGQRIPACTSSVTAMTNSYTAPVGAAMQGIDSKIKQTMDNGSGDTSTTASESTLPSPSGDNTDGSPTPGPSPAPQSVMQQLQQFTGMQTQTSGDDSSTAPADSQSPESGSTDTGQ